jgi:hypothetical protein
MDMWERAGYIGGRRLFSAYHESLQVTHPPVLRGPTGAPLGGCLPTTGAGIWYGRLAQFSGTMCYDPAGRAYVLPGSERFVGYLR